MSAWKTVVMPGLKCVIISGLTSSWRPGTNGVLRTSRICQWLHQWFGCWDMGCASCSRFQMMLSKGKWPIPSDKALTQKDFEKCENCAKTFLKFSRKKCQVLCLGWNNPTHQHRLGTEWLRLYKRELGSQNMQGGNICSHYRFCKHHMELYEIITSFIHPWWDQFWSHQDVKNLKNSAKGCKDSSGRADDLQGEG